MVTEVVTIWEILESNYAICWRSRLIVCLYSGQAICNKMLSLSGISESKKRKRLEMASESNKKSPWLLQVPVKDTKHGGNERNLRGGGGSKGRFQ